MKNFLTITFILAMVCTLKAQSSANTSAIVNLAPIAMLDIAPSNGSISMNFSMPTEAGHPISTPANDNSKYINFTSSVPTGTNRNINVAISSGSLPSGVIINAVANLIGGSGSLGTSNGTQSITGSPKILINNIGCAFTNNGNSGYNIVYSLGINDYSQLTANSSNLVLTYTLSDN